MSPCRNLPFLLLPGPIMYWKLLPPPIAINVTKCVLWQYVLPQNMCQCRHAALSQNQVIPVRQTWQSRDLNYRNIIYSHIFSNQSFKLFCWAEFYSLSGPRGVLTCFQLLLFLSLKTAVHKEVIGIHCHLIFLVSKILLFFLCSRNFFK